MPQYGPAAAYPSQTPIGATAPYPQSVGGLADETSTQADTRESPPVQESLVGQYLQALQEGKFVGPTCHGEAVDLFSTDALIDNRGPSDTDVFKKYPPGLDGVCEYFAKVGSLGMRDLKKHNYTKGDRVVLIMNYVPGFPSESKKRASGDILQYNIFSFNEAKDKITGVEVLFDKPSLFDELKYDKKVEPARTPQMDVVVGMFKAFESSQLKGHDCQSNAAKFFTSTAEVDARMEDDDKFFKKYSAGLSGVCEYYKGCYGSPMKNLSASMYARGDDVVMIMSWLPDTKKLDMIERFFLEGDDDADPGPSYEHSLISFNEDKTKVEKLDTFYSDFGDLSADSGKTHAPAKKKKKHSSGGGPAYWQKLASQPVQPLGWAASPVMSQTASNQWASMQPVQTGSQPYAAYSTGATSQLLAQAPPPQASGYPVTMGASQPQIQPIAGYQSPMGPAAAFPGQQPLPQPPIAPPWSLAWQPSGGSYIGNVPQAVLPALGSVQTEMRVEMPASRSHVRRRDDDDEYSDDDREDDFEQNGESEGAARVELTAKEAAQTADLAKLISTVEKVAKTSNVESVVDVAKAAEKAAGVELSRIAGSSVQGTMEATKAAKDAFRAQQMVKAFKEQMAAKATKAVKSAGSVGEAVRAVQDALTAVRMANDFQAEKVAQANDAVPWTKSAGRIL